MKSTNNTIDVESVEKEIDKIETTDYPLPEEIMPKDTAKQRPDMTIS